MGYKLIALDIDGTIRSNEYPLSERTRVAIDRVRDAGATVTLATGRMFQSAARAGADLDIRTPIATSQGAQIADPISGEMLLHRTMTSEMTLSAIDALEGWDLQVVAYHGHDIYVQEPSEWSEGYKQRNGVQVNVMPDFKQVAELELTRLVVVGDDDKIEVLESSLKAKFGSELHITRSLSHFCEILHPDGGKDKALEWLCDYLGIAYQDTIAFGNGYNDVQMLDWVSLGVAIGGAVPEVLAVANRVAPPIEEDGAAQVLEELLDQGLIG